MSFPKNENGKVVLCCKKDGKVIKVFPVDAKEIMAAKNPGYILGNKLPDPPKPEPAKEPSPQKTFGGDADGGKKKGKE
jgi:hypothetical protein